MAEARAKQKEIVLEGKDEALHLRRAAEEEAREQRATLQRSERRLLDREEALDRKMAAFEERETSLRRSASRSSTPSARASASSTSASSVELERVSGLSAAEAREALIGQIVDEAQAEAQHRVREIERHATGGGRGPRAPDPDHRHAAHRRRPHLARPRSPSSPCRTRR